MQRKDIESMVVRLLEPILEKTEITLVDVEYIQEKDFYLRVFLDKASGIDIDDCQFVSEELSKALDAADTIKEKYFLEVSSPGIDRPFKNDEDFVTAYGTKVDIVFASEWQGHKEIVAILASHDNDNLRIQKLVKGRLSKNMDVIDRKLVAVVRSHIDF